MNTRLSLIAISIISAVSIPTLVLASGSGGYRTDQPTQQARDPQGELYDLGRRVVVRKVTCATCLAPGSLKNKDEAAALIVRIQASEFILQANEQQAALHYLRTRYRLVAVQAR
jgi:hypothetical protein